MAAPSMTLGTTLHTSASLAAGATTNDTLDASTKFEAQVMYKVTAGATVAATFGLKIEVYELYSGTTYPQDVATGTLNPNYTYTLAGYSASQIVYSPKIYLPTGKWKIKLTNLDATNAITVEGIYDTVDAIA